MSRLRQELDAIGTQAASAGSRPSIACIEWIDPLMSAGNWVPELVEIAGGRNLIGTAGKHSPWLDWDELVACDADVIAVMPCGFDIARTRQENAAAGRRSALAPAAGRAAKAASISPTATNSSTAPARGLIESARILAEILHPDLFGNSLEGTGWVRFDTHRAIHAKPRPKLSGKDLEPRPFECPSRVAGPPKKRYPGIQRRPLDRASTISVPDATTCPTALWPRTPGRRVVTAYLCCRVLVLWTLPLFADDVHWQRINLDKTFRSEGVAAFDVNHDGKIDVVAGDVWYEAPDWKMHEIRTPGKLHLRKATATAFATSATT